MRDTPLYEGEGGERNSIGRRQKWSKKVGRKERPGEGENVGRKEKKKCSELGEVDDGVIL